MSALTAQPVRVAVVSPCPPHPGPVAAYTDELVRMLRTATPGVIPALWALGSGPGDAPVAGGMTPAGVVTPADPSAYRRVAAAMRRLGVRAALLQFGPGTAGGPNGRYLLGLTDELDRLRLPYLVTLHGLRPSMRPDEADVVRALCRHAAGVIVLSRGARAALVHNRLAAPERVAVVAQGAPPELAAPVTDGPAPEVAAALARVGAGPLLTTVDELRPATGVDVAVAALPVLAAEHPGLRYVVAGRAVGPTGRRFRADLVEAADRLGVTDRLILVDTAPTPDDLSALLHAGDVYLDPGLDRGRTSAAPLGCALFARRPVVAADCPFAREVVPPGGGLVVPPGDPVALAAAASRLLASPPVVPARWPSSAVMAEQIAGLVGLVVHPPGRRGPDGAPRGRSGPDGAERPPGRRPSALSHGRP